MDGAYQLSVRVDSGADAEQVVDALTTQLRTLMPPMIATMESM